MIVGTFQAFMVADWSWVCCDDYMISVCENIWNLYIGKQLRIIIISWCSCISGLDVFLCLCLSAYLPDSAWSATSGALSLFSKVVHIFWLAAEGLCWRYSEKLEEFPIPARTSISNKKVSTCLSRRLRIRRPRSQMNIPENYISFMDANGLIWGRTGNLHWDFSNHFLTCIVSCKSWWNAPHAGLQNICPGTSL